MSSTKRRMLATYKSSSTSPVERSADRGGSHRLLQDNVSTIEVGVHAGAK
jgi:hypothetical protein